MWELPGPPIATCMSQSERNLWLSFKKSWSARSASDVESTLHDFEFYSQHPLITAALSISNCVIAVIDLRTMSYIYNSPNFEEFTGWKKEEYLTGGVRYAFSQIPTSDQIGLSLFSDLINGYFRSLPDSEKAFYRSFWDYRVSDRQGGTFKLLQQDCALRFSAYGQIEELLTFVSKIGSVTSDDCQRLRLTNGKENHFYRYDQRLNLTSKLELLSERELQIAKLIARSKSLKGIAADLGISFNTVKVHSSRIMEKLQVNDSIEMVNVLRVWGFI